MTDPVLRLEAPRVLVEPGSQAQVTVRITNPGSIVEGYRLDLLGDGLGTWASVTPAEVSVFPKQDATALVVFAPPAGTAAPSGTFAFGVRARSTEDPSVVGVAEGDVEVGAVLGLHATLVPVTSSGRWRGRHTVTLSNWGNAPARLRLTATNPDDALGFLFRPEVVELSIGATATARLFVRTRRPFLRGTSQRLPFQVAGEPDGGDGAPVRPPAPNPYGDPGRPVVDGALTQKPILSRAVVSIATVAVLAGAAVAAFAWTRPSAGGETFEELGRPPVPQVQAVAQNATTVQLTWGAVDSVEKYTVLTVNPQTKVVTLVQAAPGEQTQLDVVAAPEAQNCYQVQAVRGSLQSDRSALTCVQTPPAPPTSTPPPSSTPPPTSSPPPSTPPASTPPTSPPTSTPAPGGGTSIAAGTWVAVLGAWPQASGDDAAARDLAGRLQAAQLPAGVLDSTTYPALQLVIGQALQPAYLAFVGPYPDQTTAQQACGAATQVSGTPTCLVRRPTP